MFGINVNRNVACLTPLERKFIKYHQWCVDFNRNAAVPYYNAPGPQDLIIVDYSGTRSTRNHNDAKHVKCHLQPIDPVGFHQIDQMTGVDWREIMLPEFSIYTNRNNFF